MNHLHQVDLEKDQQSYLNDTLANVLIKLSNFQENSCLQVVCNSTTFFIHFNEGKLVYVTNSVAPFERLERHLRRLSNQNSNLNNSIIKQPRSKFRNDLQSYTQLPSDYQSIIWLSSQGYLDNKEAITLLRRITREVFESFLCLPDPCQYKFIPKSQPITELCRFDLDTYTKQCQKRLEAWQAFSEKIWSSYQRPYLVMEQTKEIGNLTVEQNKTICKLLKGLNFRQISAIIDRDELVVAKILYPSMLDSTIVVRNPKPPFDQLPRLPKKDNISEANLKSDWHGDDSGFEVHSHSKQTAYALRINHKIACVDDDQSIHQNFAQYLDKNMFSTLTIQDAMEAFAELIEFQPELILLDIDMPNLNGYELCTLLRNHHDFKTTPIIMLNQAQGLIDQTKFKLSGATDNLIKPLSRTELLNTIWKYLP